MSPDPFAPDPQPNEPTFQLRRPSRRPDPPPADEAKPPQPGDRLFGFLLRAPLGEGAFARVFLAEQDDLGGRPVVLKVTGLEGREPQMLAQLQHTHIVPVYSAHEDLHLRVRAVCMPYFGGASLSATLHDLYKTRRPVLAGSELWTALQRMSGPAPARIRAGAAPPATERAPWIDRPFVQAAVWLTARLAEALQHAHACGILHRDIKPSNILLTASGQPMLLDFNVAAEFDPTIQSDSVVLGGTVSYMAPEHLQAVSSKSVAAGGQVDHRADLYSLGVVLYEMLSGTNPFEERRTSSSLLTQMAMIARDRNIQVPSIRVHRPDISRGLASILRMCLAPAPEQRYQSARNLAEDLNRWLADQPLRYAPEPSYRERIAKWFRRHPRFTSAAGVALLSGAALLGTGAALVVGHQRLTQTQARLHQAETEKCRRDFDLGLQRALCLVNTVSDLHDQRDEGTQICEQTLTLYGVLDADDWQTLPLYQALIPEQRREVAEGARELLVLLAWARVRAAPADRQVLREALALLDRAEAIDGLPPCRAIHADRARYAKQLGDQAITKAAEQRAQQIDVKTVHDRYLLAVSLARVGRNAEAIDQLTIALDQNRLHYWALMQRGLCYLEQSQPALAAADFGAGIGLWPEFAWSYFNRAYALAQSGHKLEAIRDYTAALERDSDSPPALLNRGLTYLELSLHDMALKDFDRLKQLGRVNAVYYLGRGAALEGLGQHEAADEAFASAFSREVRPTDAALLRLQYVYGFAVSARLPDKADEAFAAVLRAVPEHPEALYGKGMLLARRGDHLAALALFDRAVQAAPTFTDARRFRGVLLARVGRFDEAMREVNWCLDREPTAAITLYAAGCVAALARAQASTPDARRSTETQAVAFLDRALAAGYGRQQVETDRDLHSIRDCSGYRALLKRYPLPPR